MRITNQMMINNAIQHMSENLDRLSSLSERTSTGKQFQVASDDPISASLSLSLKSTLKTTDVYKTTANLANDWMSASDFALDQMQTITTNVQNLILRGLNDSLGSSERAASLGTEMDALLQQAIEAGNTSHDGQYLFSGYQTDKAPFDLADPTACLSDGKSMLRTIGPGQTVVMNVDGKIFQPFLKALMDARDALNANNTGNLRTALSALQLASTPIDEARTSNGARQRQVQTAADYLDKVEINIKSLLSKNEDANMAESISQLQGQQTTYQAVLEVSQRAVSALNLFDYLK